MIVLSVLLLIILLAFLGYFLVYAAKNKKSFQSLVSDNNDLRKKNRDLLESVSSLSKYQSIADVEAEIARIRLSIDQDIKNAQESVSALMRDSERIVSENEALRDQAKKELAQQQKEASDKQATILQSASIQSAAIIDEANKKAEEIAGDAYRALKEVDHLKATLQAIQNSINGYGDEYLIPNHAALDDLADDYSHTQAGIDLATARETVRQMIASGTAADCDYVDPQRRNTAILFVLDAFNGKVDSTLAKVKHNNYGKLQQELIDAYTLVNQHGQAFRNARIRASFLDSRQKELKLAVAVMELQQKERDEQRRIKQEMQEEERARREYEKAIKQAEKEEKLLEKLMEEARLKLEAASLDERSQYEQKIKELEDKYREAEERNQRALSMAQQTKRGHVYVISNVGSFGEDVFKIGLTRRLEPLDRVKELGDASVPFDFDVHAMIYNEDAPKLEATLHSVFSDFQVNRVNARKEFFRISVKEIKALLDRLGVQAKWTMIADAKEYRESVALEESLKFSKAIKEPSRELIASLSSTIDTSIVSPVDPRVNFNRQSSDVAISVAADLPARESFDVDDIDGIVCPDCQGMLDVQLLVSGLNKCPHCQSEFEVSM